MFLKNVCLYLCLTLEIDQLLGKLEWRSDLINLVKTITMEDSGAEVKRWPLVPNVPGSSPVIRVF